GLSDWLANLGLILHKEGSRERGERLLRRAEAILVQKLGRNHPQVTQVTQAIQALAKLPPTASAAPAPVPVQVAPAPVATAPDGEPALQAVRQAYTITPATIVPLEPLPAPSTTVTPPVVVARGEKSPGAPEAGSVAVAGKSHPAKESSAREGSSKEVKQGAVVHLSCFAMASPHAEQLTAKIRALSYPAYRKLIKNGETSFECVFAGPFSTRPEAEVAAEKIRVGAGVENPLVGRYTRGE
ncbi:MAG: SPOR domain-containing protein, partial [Magnetococcales bacterium]|nr:SPOR domain-containing protein [Magnetococcales bacterium]